MGLPFSVESPHAFSSLASFPCPIDRPLGRAENRRFAATAKPSPTRFGGVCMVLCGGRRERGAGCNHHRLRDGESNAARSAIGRHIFHGGQRRRQSSRAYRRLVPGRRRCRTARDAHGQWPDENACGLARRNRATCKGGPSSRWLSRHAHRASTAIEGGRSIPSAGDIRHPGNEGSIGDRGAIDRIRFQGPKPMTEFTPASKSSRRSARNSKIAA
jgi:hypothetical protein